MISMILCIGEGLQNKLKLITSSDCLCPGDTLTYECVVIGSRFGATVWRGSAFDCPSSEISLLHSAYAEGSVLCAHYGECNNGSIIAQSLSVELLQFSVKCHSQCRYDWKKYRMSLWWFKLNNFTISRCNKYYRWENVYDIIAVQLLSCNVPLIDANCNHPTDFLPPSPSTIYASLIDTISKQITFTWSSVTPECLTTQYNILSSNCGSCPTTTNHTTVICTDVPTAADNNSACKFSVQAINCNFIIGKFSDPITVFLKEMATSNNVLNTQNPSDITISNHNRGYITSLSLACVLAVGLVMSIVTVIALIITYQKGIRVKEETTTIEPVTPAAAHFASGDYENVIQSSQEHITTSENIAYYHVVNII